jgi:hypothetical protein
MLKFCHRVRLFLAINPLLLPEPHYHVAVVSRRVENGAYRLEVKRPRELR